MNVHKYIETAMDILLLIVGFALMCSLFGVDISTMPPRIHEGITGLLTSKNFLEPILFTIGMFCMVTGIFYSPLDKEDAEMCRTMRMVGCLSWGMLLAILFI